MDVKLFTPLVDMYFYPIFMLILKLLDIDFFISINLLVKKSLNS